MKNIVDPCQLAYQKSDDLDPQFSKQDTSGLSMVGMNSLTNFKPYEISHSYQSDQFNSV